MQEARKTYFTAVEFNRIYVSRSDHIQSYFSSRSCYFSQDKPFHSYLELCTPMYEMSRVRYTFCEMNKQAIVVNHTSYPECEIMVSPPFPDRFLTLIRHGGGTRRARGVDPQTFVHRLEDSSSRARCLLDDEEEKREKDPARAAPCLPCA